MGLTLIEAAKYENRLEHLAVLKTFSEGELLAQLPFMNIAGSDLFYSAGQELRDGTTGSWISASRVRPSSIDHPPVRIASGGCQPLNLAVAANQVLLYLALQQRCL